MFKKAFLNYSHILIFYNKTGPTYDILYEFNVFKKTPNQIYDNTYTGLIF